jgi:hypothetical protein
MKPMTVRQVKAVHDAYEAINASLLSIKDLNEVLLSDIKALDRACYSLFNEFNMREQDD